MKKIMELKNKEPFVILLCGTPLSGKSTFVKENFPDVEVINRDEIVMEVYGSRNYSEAFNKVNQKEVDRILNRRMLEFGLQKKNVIVDMTNMTIKRRKSTLVYFPHFYKIAIVFPFLSNDEYERRNTKRNSEENKNIPISVLNRMISSYEEVTEDEGFNEIIKL